MTDRTWQSAHIYYYDDNKNALILDCIQPLLKQTSQVVPRSFFVRHWLQGPHLRIRFACDEEQFITRIKPLIEAEVGQYLQTHPSQTQLEAEKLRPMYELLAKQEQEDGPILPLYPNNTIQYIPYDRRLHVLKDTKLADLIEDFYVETNDMVIAMLDYARQGHSVLTLGFDLMVTVAHTMGTHIARGFISYRSHAEGFIMNCAQPATMRAMFDRKYVAQAKLLHMRLNQLLEALKQTDQTLPFLLAWTNIMQIYWNRVEPLILDEQLNLMPQIEEGIPENNHAKKLAYSDFHTTLESDQIRKKMLYDDSWFQCYRLMLNLLYLHLNRLGLQPIDRFLLCHLVANTVEQTLGISATAMMQQSDYTMQETM